MYIYGNLKYKTLGDDGQRLIIKLTLLLKTALIRQEGSSQRVSTIIAEDVMSLAYDHGGVRVAGSSWEALAFVDRLMELGVLEEVKLAEPPVAQHRLFRAGPLLRAY